MPFDRCMIIKDLHLVVSKFFPPDPFQKLNNMYEIIKDKLIQF